MILEKIKTLFNVRHYVKLKGIFLMIKFKIYWTKVKFRQFAVLWFFKQNANFEYSTVKFLKNLKLSGSNKFPIFSIFLSILLNHSVYSYAYKFRRKNTNGAIRRAKVRSRNRAARSSKRSRPQLISGGWDCRRNRTARFPT